MGPDTWFRALVRRDGLVGVDDTRSSRTGRRVRVRRRPAARWYPAGSASIAGSFEYDDAGLRSLIVTATIENTGSSAISRSTYTITATTDALTYWKTVESETRVLPGAKIKVTDVIEYLGSTETLKTDGLVIGDAFFE
jgi:hypothetical protein